MEFSQPVFDTILVPGEFKLDHLQPFKPNLFWIFCNFWLLCPRALFLYSPGKWENGILPNKYRGLGAWGIASETGPFKTCQSFFVLKNFQLLTFIRKMRKWNSSNLSETWRIGCSYSVPDTHYAWNAGNGDRVNDLFTSRRRWRERRSGKGNI